MAFCPKNNVQGVSHFVLCAHFQLDKKTLYAVVASLFAMIINSGILVIISGLFGVALAPYAAFQQQKITQTIAMKETNEYFEKQLTILKASNERLSEQNKHMTEAVDK